jgi:hypothetical protein
MTSQPSSAFAKLVPSFESMGVYFHADSKYHGYFSYQSTFNNENGSFL